MARKVSGFVSNAKIILTDLIMLIEMVRIEMHCSLDYQPSRVISIGYLVDQLQPKHPDLSKTVLKQYISYMMIRLPGIESWNTNSKSPNTAFIVHISTNPRESTICGSEGKIVESGVT